MFYQSISDVYDYIFPQNRKQMEFLMGTIDIQPENHVLDIGCATGNLTQLISKQCDVTGLDLDQALLNKAKEKNDLPFIHGNMLNLKALFDEPFDHIVSFGNTLVHLPSRELVKEFFSAVYDALNKNGTFTVQIINYDRILDQNIDHLPTIDNDEIKFVRDYAIKTDKVDFITQLTIKSTGQVIDNSIELLALRKEELRDMLEKAGFNSIRFYGGLNSSPLSNESIPLIFTCVK